jgi:recombination protein RecT
MTTAIQTAPISAPVQTLRQQLTGDYFKQQVALALPKHMTPDRFVRVGLTALMKTPKLMECSPESVIQCMLNCSALGLEPDGRRAHLIPYGNTCTLIVDYKGMIELAKRSGDVSNVFAQIVCENDSFQWENGEVKHQIDFKRERGAVYAAYAVIAFKDGTKQTDVMTKAEVEAIRKRSRAGESGPWKTDWNEMAKKTVVRRAMKFVTLSPELADAVEADDAQFTSAPVTVKPVFAVEQMQPASIEVAASSTPAAEEDDIPMSDAATPQAKLSEFLTSQSVSFDDFRSFVATKNIAKDSDSWTSFEEVPTAVCQVLEAQHKTMAELIRKFGKVA